MWSNQGLLDMRGSPWDPAGDADAGEYKTAAPEPHQEPMRGGLYTERAVSLREFWEKKGKTSGCTACLVPGGRHHTLACKRRQLDFKAEAPGPDAADAPRRRPGEDTSSPRAEPR